MDSAVLRRRGVNYAQARYSATTSRRRPTRKFYKEFLSRHERIRRVQTCRQFCEADMNQLGRSGVYVLGLSQVFIAYCQLT